MSEPRNRTKYSYDPVGNRLSSLGVSPYSVNSSNELTSTPSATYTYDNNGNALTKVTSAGTTTFGWDYENRLTSVTLPGTGGTLAFKYDGIGRRVQKEFTQNSTSTTTNYLYDGFNGVADLDQSGSVLARYTMTQRIDEPLAELRSGTTSYYSQDGLGSVTSLTTASGALGNSYRYDSFGDLTASSGSIVNRFQYTAREFDSETGLYYYRARYYDPVTGRFLSEDPLTFDGDSIDFYEYSTNNPGTVNDPFGTQASKPTPPPNPSCTTHPELCGPVGQPLYDPPGWTIPPPPQGTAAPGLPQGYDPQTGAVSPGAAPAPAPTPGRSIPQPPCPKRGCTCTCRADADDTMPGNIKPGLPLFAFGTATASNCSEATKDAKRIATRALGMKPKHIPCKCSE